MHFEVSFWHGIRFKGARNPLHIPRRELDSMCHPAMFLGPPLSEQIKVLSLRSARSWPGSWVVKWGGELN